MPLLQPALLPPTRSLADPLSPCLLPAAAPLPSEEQARQIKALNPDTHVWHYRNMQLRLTRNEFDCPKMFDERYAGYFLHNRDGSFLNTTAQFLPQWMGCDVAFPDATYPNETTQLYLDWRNESARNWWLDVHIGSIINSTVVDGFYCENSPSLTLVYAAGGGRRADDCCLT